MGCLVSVPHPKTPRLPRRPLPEKKRHTYLGPAHVRLLDDWGKALRTAFPDAFGAYLVGSALTRPNYRDIDVRIILPDTTFDHLEAAMKPRRLNLMLTLWGQQVTGLNIDCQVQRQSFSQATYPLREHPRNPLGLRDVEGDEGA